MPNFAVVEFIEEQLVEVVHETWILKSTDEEVSLLYLYLLPKCRQNNHLCFLFFSFFLTWLLWKGVKKG